MDAEQRRAVLVKERRRTAPQFTHQEIVAAHKQQEEADRAEAGGATLKPPRTPPPRPLTSSVSAIVTSDLPPLSDPLTTSVTLPQPTSKARAEPPQSAPQRRTSERVVSAKDEGAREQELGVKADEFFKNSSISSGKKGAKITASAGSGTDAGSGAAAGTRVPVAAGRAHSAGMDAAGERPASLSLAESSLEVERDAEVSESGYRTSAEESGATDEDSGSDKQVVAKPDEPPRAKNELPVGEYCPHFSDAQPDSPYIEEVFPMTTDEFYFDYLKDDNGFWAAAAVTANCTDVVAGAWISESSCCRSRVITFNVPVNHFLGTMGIGPKMSAVTQRQRIRMESDTHLQFETSSVTHDIPYSDVFTVETKWNVWTEETEEGRPPCTWVHLHWEVHFFDSVWLKGMITRNAMEGAELFFTSWVRTAKDYLRFKQSKRSSIKGESRPRASIDRPLLTSRFEVQEARPVPAAETLVTAPASPALRRPSSVVINSGEHKKADVPPASPLPTDAPAAAIGVMGRETGRITRDEPVKLAVSSGGLDASASKTSALVHFIYTAVVLFVLATFVVPLVFESWGAAETLRMELHQIRSVSPRIHSQLDRVQALLAETSAHITESGGESVLEQWNEYWRTGHGRLLSSEIPAAPHDVLVSGEGLVPGGHDSFMDEVWLYAWYAYYVTTRLWGMSIVVTGAVYGCYLVFSWSGYLE